MDWESLSRPFIQGPVIRKLTSIDMVKGQARAYTAPDGDKPTLKGIIDFPSLQCAPEKSDGR